LKAEAPQVIEAREPLLSPASTGAHVSQRLRIGAVQHRWQPDPVAHSANLAAAAKAAADRGAQLICMQELTLSPYFAQAPDGAQALGIEPEELPGGPTYEFAAALAAQTGAHIHASLYERAPELDGSGYNTAILVAPGGELVARTRKLHLPVTAGYFEDRYFTPGPADDAFPVAEMDGVRVGLPTCWDQWFPEVARAYALGGSQLLIFPTAIGSEPDHPDFDTEPLWERVMTAAGIANGQFIVAVNRIGTEGRLTFYGSSFVSDPYGRKLVQAPRDEAAVIVADLELSHGRDWLDLFPFLQTRRPDAYGPLTAPS
jgi:N-carbamoylputrescine amidase